MNNFNGDFIQYSEKKVKNETKNLALYFILHITLYIVLIFFAIFFIWYTVFVSTHSFYAVKGASMKNTLNSEVLDGDREGSYDAVYVNRTSNLRDFDIVVVERGEKDSIIKRLMATEGDYITIAKANDGYFHFFRISGVSEENLDTISDEDAMLDEESGELGYQIRGYESWTNRRGAYSVSGHDYEENFFDVFLSYYWENDAPYEYHISSSGLVYVRVPQGKVFCMGDNRGFSTDSRESGFLDRENVVGRAEFVVYNYNFVNRIWEVVKFYFSEVEKFFAR